MHSTNSFQEYNTQNLRPQYLDVKDGRLEYVIFGKGSPIVFINGYTADIASWDNRMLKRLATQHEIILFNNRGVGGSIITSNNYNSNDLASDTDQLIQGLKLTKPAILGFSMGGMIAQQLAVTHPECVSKLILMNTFISGNKAIPFDPEIRKQLFNLPRSSISRLLIALKLFFPKGSRFKATTALLFHRFVPSSYPFDNYPSDLTLKNQQELVIQWFSDNSTAKMIEQLSIDTLILTGEKDIVVNPKNSEILSMNIAHSNLIKWKDGGHAMLFQYPEEIADVINQFLK